MIESSWDNWWMDFTIWVATLYSGNGLNIFDISWNCWTQCEHIHWEPQWIMMNGDVCALAKLHNCRIICVFGIFSAFAPAVRRLLPNSLLRTCRTGRNLFFNKVPLLDHVVMNIEKVLRRNIIGHTNGAHMGKTTVCFLVNLPVPSKLIPGLGQSLLQTRSFQTFFLWAQISRASDRSVFWPLQSYISVKLLAPRQAHT